MDCIDLFYLHRIDQLMPVEVSMYGMKKLVEEGKVKYVGLSECSAQTIRRAHKIHPITAIQMEYSLWCRGIEKEILPTCKELGIGLVAYAPLGRGFLATGPDAVDGVHHHQQQGTFHERDIRRNAERFHSDRNRRMVEELAKFAETKGVTIAQLALAWVGAQQDRAAGVVAIPETRADHLWSNVESLNIIQLSKEDLEMMEHMVPWEGVEGARAVANTGYAIWEIDRNPELTPELATKWMIPF